jgi:hypothetical protein
MTISNRIMLSGIYIINIAFVNKLSLGLTFVIFSTITSITRT